MTAPLSKSDLDEIASRAAHLYEYAQQTGEGDTLAGIDVPALLARVAELETAAALVAEYHLLMADDRWLAVRREPQGDRWAVYTAGRVLGDRKAWTGEMWISIALATDSELWAYDSAEAALEAATKLTAAVTQ